MEFEYADLNGDKKISLDEWKGVFFHEQPQEATYVDGELQDVSNAPEEVASCAHSKSPLSAPSALSSGAPLSLDKMSPCSLASARISTRACGMTPRECPWSGSRRLCARSFATSSLTAAVSGSLHRYMFVGRRRQERN